MRPRPEHRGLQGSPGAAGDRSLQALAAASPSRVRSEGGDAGGRPPGRAREERGQGGRWRAGPAAPAPFPQPGTSRPWASPGWSPGTGTCAGRASPGVSRSTGDFLKSVSSPFQRAGTLEDRGWRVPPCFWYGGPPPPIRGQGLHTAPWSPMQADALTPAPSPCKAPSEVGSAAMPRLPLWLLL